MSNEDSALEVKELRGEVRALRAEVEALRNELRSLRGGAAVRSGGGAPALSWDAMPADLQKRLQPLRNGLTAAGDGKSRALWLLEVSENVEDYLRYGAEDWPGADTFAEQLVRLGGDWGLQRIIPQEGDPVDHSQHLVLQTVPGADRRDLVARCARPGYSFGGELLRRAEVVVYL